MERKEWRIIQNKESSTAKPISLWHYVEIFPEATRYGSACGLYSSFGLFDKISEDLPIPGVVKGELCLECVKKYYEEKGE